MIIHDRKSLGLPPFSNARLCNSLVFLGRILTILSIPMLLQIKPYHDGSAETMHRNKPTFMIPSSLLPTGMYYNNQEGKSSVRMLDCPCCRNQFDFFPAYRAGVEGSFVREMCNNSFLPL